MKLPVEESEFIPSDNLSFYNVFPDRVRLLRVLHGGRDLQAEMRG
jgi:plasmid stabilization system protein ParE